jgi:hypothetical protein
VSGSQYSVNSNSLVSCSQNFTNAAPTMTTDAQAVNGALPVSTGNAALDAMIQQKCTQVASSLNGCSQAMQADANNMVANATTYTSSDQQSVPATTTIAPSTPSLVPGG